MNNHSVTVTLTRPQHEFVTSPYKFPAMVAGYGSGKTAGAIERALAKKLSYKTCNVAYYLPTYDLVKTIAFPRFEEIFEQRKIRYRLNKNDKEIILPNMGKIIFRTMDNPERIVGYEVADSLVDELDILTRDKAYEVWKKIIARNRQKKPDGSPNTVGVATTPEGFRFVYERWKKSPGPEYKLIKASTYSNRMNLPDDYIDTLKEDYPENLLAAYINGEFVNLAFMSVYSSFDRELNHTSDTIQAEDALHIGMDFNVGQMAAVVHVLRTGEDGAQNAHAVAELTGIFDTPAMIRVIQERWPGRSIIVYPDASGKNRKTVNASESDITLLRQAGFTVLVNSRNPFVRDRVLSMNVKLKRREYRVNVDKCPSLVEALEQQAYDKNGEPDKMSGLDHIVDAAGYFTVYRYPVTGAGVKQFNLTGV